MKRSANVCVRKILGCLLLLACFAAAGCVKIRLTVQLNEDGSGQVVEEVVFGEMIVDAAKKLKEGPTIAELTGDQQIQRRLSHMGKGVKLVNRKVETQPDGSVRMVATYSFDDINALKLAPIPFGPGWEDVHLAFHLHVDTNLDTEHHLSIRMHTPQDKVRPQAKKTELPRLSERESQQIRQLLPIFKDMLEGFELKLRLEIYDAKKWASITRGHQAWGGPNGISTAGGRQTVFHLTDKHLRASDDGLMLLVAWRQIGREFDLEKGVHAWTGAQLLPHVHYFLYGDRMEFKWRAFQTPRGREYY